MKPRPVLITWHDTVSSNDGWGGVEEIKGEGLEPFMACGLLIHKDRQFYTLASLIATGERIGAWVKIPRGCVLKLKYLR